MPTGYTAIINDKPDVTFEEFTLRCARAMGALIALRDEPMDAPIPDDVGFKSTYHGQALENARAHYEKVNALTDEEAEREAEIAFNGAVKRRDEAIQKATEERARYEAMLTQVRAWEPPTPDHQGLKDFMIQQIEESIKFDCSTLHWDEMEIKRQTGTEWKAEALGRALHDIDYHAKHGKEDDARDRDRNEWVRQLRDSLKPKGATAK